MGKKEQKKKYRMKGKRRIQHSDESSSNSQESVASLHSDPDSSNVGQRLKQMRDLFPDFYDDEARIVDEQESLFSSAESNQSNRCTKNDHFINLNDDLSEKRNPLAPLELKIDQSLGNSFNFSSILNKIHSMDSIQAQQPEQLEMQYSLNSYSASLLNEQQVGEQDQQSSSMSEQILSQSSSLQKQDE